VANYNVEIVTKATALATGEPTTRKSWNVWHFQRPTLTPALSMVNVEAAFQTAIQLAVLDLLSVSYVQTTTEVRCIDDASMQYTVVSRAQTGTVTGDSLPSGNTVNVIFRSGLRGNDTHGGKKFGPIAESSTTLDQLNAGAQTDWTAFMATVLAGFTDSDGNVWKPFILNRSTSQLSVNPTRVMYQLIQSAAYNIPLGFMRKRTQTYRAA